MVQFFLQEWSGNAFFFSTYSPCAVLYAAVHSHRSRKVSAWQLIFFYIGESGAASCAAGNVLCFVAATDRQLR
jgi:hypothetical protein